MSISIFSVIKDIVEKRNLIEQNKDLIEKDGKINSYMINRFLSMNKKFIRIVNELQVYSQCLDKLEYIKLLQSVIPKQYQGYHQYIKKNDEFYCQNCQKLFLFTEDKKTKAKCPHCGNRKVKVIPTDIIILYISKYFGVSKKEAIEYRKLLDYESILDILDKFGEVTKSIVEKVNVNKKKKNISLKNYA